MAEGLRVLIIGCGAIAGGFDTGRPNGADPLTHAGAYRRHGGFQLIACVDPDRTRREGFAARWSIANAFADVEQAKTTGPYDVVSICSPTSLHYGHVLAAVGMRGRLIFCEKPVTPDLATTQRLVAICEAAGIALAVNHTRRWAPDVVRLRKELAEGEWGAVRAVHGTYNKGVLNNGSHMIDLVQFLLGPLRFVAAGEPVYDFWHHDPTVPAILATQAAVPVTLGVANAADYAVSELTIFASRGAIAMEEGGQAWRVRAPIDSLKFSGYKSLDRGKWRIGAYDEAMLGAAGEIHNALLHGKPVASTGKTAAAAQALCAAIRDAAAKHENTEG